MKSFLVIWLFFIISIEVLAQQPKLMLPIGHTDKVTSVQFSSDGKRFLTASLDNTVKLWDWDTQKGKILAVMSEHKNGVSSAIFSPDNKTIITSDGAGRIKLWDAETGNYLKELGNLNSKVIYIQFSPDSKKLITTSADGTCKIWDWYSKTPDFELISYKKVRRKNDSGGYTDVQTGEDDIQEASESYEEIHKEIQNSKEFFQSQSDSSLKSNNTNFIKKGIIKLRIYTFFKLFDLIYKIPTKIAKWQYKKPIKFDSLYHEDKEFLESYECSYAEFSPDMKKIITTSSDGSVKIWDALTRKKLFDLNFILSKKPLFISEGINGVKTANFSSDNSKILTLSRAGVGIWDAKNGHQLNLISGEFTRASFLLDESKVMTADEDGKIEIWNVLTEKSIKQLEGHKANIESLIFSKDGTKFLTSSTDKTAKLWDLRTNNLLMDFAGHSKTVTSAKFSPDGTNIITASEDNTVSIWEITTGDVIFNSKGHTSFGLSASFSNDNSKIIVAYNTGNPLIWSRYNGQIIDILSDNKHPIRFAKYSYDDKKILTNSPFGYSKLWDTESGDTLLTILKEDKYGRDRNTAPQLSPNGKFILSSNLNEIFLLDVTNGEYVNGMVEAIGTRFTSLEFSADGNKIAAIHANYAVKVWDFNNFGKFEPKDMWDKDPYAIELKGHKAMVNSAKFSFDGKKIVTASSDYNSKIFDASSGKELHTLIGHTGELVTAEFSRNDKRIATGSWDGTAKIWDAKNGRFIFDLRGHNGVISALNFSNDNKSLLTASKDNTCKLWDVETGKLKYTFFAIDSADYFNYLPNGYYFSSKNASKQLHYVDKNLRVISFEQLDVKYNRPDKVLQAIGNTDTLLIKSYRRAYEKRIEKLKIDTTFFNENYDVPDADFVNQNVKEENGKITITIKGEDKNNKLDQYNVWVNEVPIYGLRGVNIRDKNRNEFEFTITIPLSVGENQIETSFRNVNGIESYRKPLRVDYNPSIKPKEKVYFVGIGIDKFEDESHNLQYCSKDIRELAREMEKKYGKNNIEFDTLINRNVTVKNIKAIKNKLLNTTINDKVIVAYSGHGLLNSKKDYYLSTYSVNFENPEENGLLYEDLESILDSIPARKKLLLLDACHSGEVDKGDMPQTVSTNQESGRKTAQLSSETFKGKKTEKKPKVKFGKGGSPTENTNGNKVGLYNSFELMQNLFVNVGKSTGATVFAAAAGTQSAYESNDLRQGIFTFAVLEALKKGTQMKVSNLKKMVEEIVAEKSKNTQKPTSRSETISFDWVLW